MACLVCLGVSVSEGLALCRSTPSESPVRLMSDSTPSHRGRLAGRALAGADGNLGADRRASVRDVGPALRLSESSEGG